MGAWKIRHKTMMITTAIQHNDYMIHSVVEKSYKSSGDIMCSQGDNKCQRGAINVKGVLWRRVLNVLTVCELI